MSGTPEFRRVATRAFVNYCKTKLGWSNLSNQRILDVGCGKEIFCGRSILDIFPEVQEIIAIDKYPQVVKIARLYDGKKIKSTVADIEHRYSIQRFEGKMDKVVSTRCFQELIDKRAAFENVYRILKPNGEAAIQFATKAPIARWVTEMCKNPKWRSVYQGDNDTEMCIEDLDPRHFELMVQEIGFKVLQIDEWCHDVVYESEEDCIESLKSCSHYFKVPPESITEFTEDSLGNFIWTNSRNKAGKILSTSLDLSLLLVKP